MQKSPEFQKNARRAQSGQAVLTDLVFSAFVFVLLFAFIYSGIQSNISKASSEQDFEELSGLASESLDMLVSSKGIPGNWFLLADSDINSIGLAKKPLVIDDRKLSRFLSMDYESARQKFNLSYNDFYFRISNSSGFDRNFGILPTDSNNNVVSLSRVVDYKGVESIVEFTAFSQS